MTEWWNSLSAWEQTFFAVVGTFLIHLFVKIVLLRALNRLADSTENDLDDRLVQFARSFFGIIIFFTAFLLCLNAHGIPITAALAGAGIAGIAIGFAAKESLADILAGIFLITDRPMRVGDRVKIERIGRDWGGWGDVVDVGIRRTTVRNTDGVIVNYPNSILATSVITNFSHEGTPVRVRVRFQLDYSADLDKATEIAEAAISRTEKVIPETAQVVVRSVWDTTRGHLLAGVLMEGRYRIEDVRDRTRIRSAVLKNVLADLWEAGVPLAAPEVMVGKST